MLAIPSIDWKNVIPWLLRAWSPLAVLLLISIYVLLVYYFDYDKVNKYYGVCLQVLGGVFLLIPIFGNLEIFRDTSILKLIDDWAKDFPIKKTHTINILTTLKPFEVLPLPGMFISQTIPPNVTIEERIKALEDGFQSINSDIKGIKDDRKQDLIRNEFNLDALETRTNSKTDEELNKINTKIKIALTGDIQTPIFGGILTITGTILSLF